MNPSTATMGDPVFQAKPSALPSTEHLVWLSAVERPCSQSHTPAPYLDVLSFHSRRYLPPSPKPKVSRERNSEAFASFSTTNRQYINHDEAVSQLKMQSSVPLVLEPIQLPDLKHTTVFDAPLHSTTSFKAGVLSPHQSTRNHRNEDMKLRLPTHAKHNNMRDYIKETIHKHFSPEKVASGQCLETSTSTPTFPSPLGDSLSPFKPRSCKKKSKRKGLPAPVLASRSPGALLNPHLRKQAKDVIAAVRANSAKINHLISH